jgi:hypothetical protein
MSYLNSISITASNDDLEEMKISYYPDMVEKYNIMLGDISIWFTDYKSFKKFALAIQSGFEKTLKTLPKEVLEELERLAK